MPTADTTPFRERGRADDAELRRTVWLMRLVSAVMLILSGVGCLASREWPCILAGMAFLVSLLATASRSKSANALWAVTWMVGLVLMECWALVK